MLSYFGSFRRFSVGYFFAFALFVLSGYSAWALGGVYPPLQWPLVSASILMLGALVLAPAHGRERIQTAFLHDPIFYIGLAFLLLLLIQWVNSDYKVMWDNVASAGMERTPSRWIPWSVEPQTAGQMLNWFVPVWTAVLIVRHRLDRSSVRLLLYLMVWNAVILAVVGWGQKLLGVEKMLGIWSIPGGSFFATFSYVNHAGAWFYLHAALSAGLAHQALRHREPPAQIIVWISCAFICLAAALSSLSRAAGLAALILTIAAFGLLIRWAWKRADGNQVLHAVGLSVIVALAGLVLYFGSGGGALAREIDDTFWGERMEDAVEGRTIQLPGACEIAGDYPLFGCGGWGYRWVALLHIPIDEWPRWQQAAGKANVHCDPLQFLVEFGGVGVLLMTAFSVVMMVGGFRSGKYRVLRNWMGLGLLLVFLHSWVDLPFRCPAILLAWCIMLAAAGTLAAPDPQQVNRC